MKKGKEAVEICEMTAEETALLARLQEPLIAWYDCNKRDLPWRRDITPYRVWLSEIMLQQTRVEAGREYFLRFIGELPNVEALANVPDEQLMKLWEGLGYYNRARNLKKAAGVLMERYGGEFPSTYEELLELPGIGPYTAGVISSIAFSRCRPSVDGNVLRVIMRVLGRRDDIGKESVKRAVERALLLVMESGMAHERPGDFNQSLMELGAIVCIPNGRPHCDRCPWAADCVAKAEGITMELPVKQVKKSRRIEERTVLILRDEKERLLLHRREERGLLAGMWELPALSGKLDEQGVRQAVKPFEEKLQLQWLRPAGEAVHVFSHVEWHMTAFEGRIRPASGADAAAAAFGGTALGAVAEESRPYLKDVRREEPRWIWADAKQIREEIALPSAFKGFRKIMNGEE